MSAPEGSITADKLSEEFNKVCEEDEVAIKELVAKYLIMYGENLGDGRLEEIEKVLLLSYRGLPTQVSKMPSTTEKMSSRDLEIVSTLTKQQYLRAFDIWRGDNKNKWTNFGEPNEYLTEKNIPQKDEIRHYCVPWLAPSYHHRIGEGFSKHPSPRGIPLKLTSGELDAFRSSKGTRVKNSPKARKETQDVELQIESAVQIINENLVAWGYSKSARTPIQLRLLNDHGLKFCKRDIGRIMKLIKQ